MAETAVPLATETESSGTEWRKCISLLVLAGLAAYCNSLTKAFVMDDYAWIVNNLNLSDISWAWRPAGMRSIPNSTLTLNYWFGGRNVAGYHAVNFAVHLCAGLALFGVVRRTLLLARWEGRFRRSAPWLAFATALLWLVHPLQTQAVTYVIQRHESMMGMFYLLTLYCAVRGAESGLPARRWWHAGAVLCCALGMMSKEVMVSAPLIVILYDWTFLPGPFGRTFRQRWGLYAGLAVTWVVPGFRLLAAPGDPTAGFSSTAIPARQYLLTQAGVILYYLKLSFWPTGLCLSYRGWSMAETWRDWLVPGLVVTALLLATVWGVVRRSWWGVVGAWFFLILGVTSSFMPIIDVAFEHRMYLPLASLVVLVVVAADGVRRWAASRPGIGERRPRVLAAALLGLVALVLCGLTVRRNEDYRSEVSMWLDMTKKRPDNPFAFNGLAMAYHRAGNIEEAAAAMTEANRILGRTSDTLAGSAAIRLAKGDVKGAIAYCREGLPNYYRPEIIHNIMAWALLLEGNVREARDHFREAVRLLPRQPLYHRNLATALYDVGEREEAAAEYRESLRLEPGWPEDNNRVARSQVLTQAAKKPLTMREAILMAKQCCQATDHQNVAMLDTLALAYAADGRFKEAAATAQLALDRAAATGQEEWVAPLQERLRLYRSGKSLHREGAPAKKAARAGS